MSSLFLLLAIIGTLILPGCSNKSKLPTSSYEKVQFAFNGVEKSFKKLPSASSAEYGEIRFLSSRNTAESALSEETPAVVFLADSQGNNPLDLIESMYTPGDSQGDIIDDLEYDQPPMIQFQCLKYILEKFGSNYSFGTKYYDDISGDVYVDLETGFEDTEHNEANKYKYRIRFSICIDIDKNDLITAQVGFDITLTKGQESINTHWYVEMTLDYNMISVSPYYELLMLTVNDEDELTYKELAKTYEYDYVKVEKGNIIEWRKFVFEADRTVKLDAAHPTLDSYLEEGIRYSADTVKWYKDHDLRKKTDHDSEASIAKAFFALGLNSTEIDSTKFVVKSGQQTAIISNFYKTVCQKFGKDVAYKLLCRNEEDRKNDNRPVRIAAFLDGYDEEYSTMVVYHDMTGAEFLTVGQELADLPTLPAPSFYYITKDGEKGERITDFSGAQFDFYEFNQDPTQSVPSVSLDYNGFTTSSMQNILEMCNYQARLVLTIGGLTLQAVIYYSPN